jgi:hypothetical protein
LCYDLRSISFLRQRLLTDAGNVTERSQHMATNFSPNRATLAGFLRNVAF